MRMTREEEHNNYMMNIIKQLEESQTSTYGKFPKETEQTIKDMSIKKEKEDYDTFEKLLMTDSGDIFNIINDFNRWLITGQKLVAEEIEIENNNLDKLYEKIALLNDEITDSEDRLDTLKRLADIIK